MRSNFFLKSKIDAVSCISGLKRLKSRAAWYVSFCFAQFVCYRKNPVECNAQLLEKLRLIALAETCRFLTIQLLDWDQVNDLFTEIWNLT